MSQGVGWTTAALLACGLCGCAANPPVKIAAPSQPLDLQYPQEPPDPSDLARLPALWEQEPQRSAFRIESGPLIGRANFDELDGPLASQYARSPYLVAEGGDDDRQLVTRLPSEGARPLMQQANQAFAAGRLDEALAGYRQVIERDPQFAKPYFYVAEIESQRRDLEAAAAWIDRGLRLSPRDTYAYALRAEILTATGRPEAARGDLAYALALDPFSPRGLKLLRQLGGARTPGIEPPVLVARAAPSDGGAAVLVARGGGHPAWRPYAVCRALLAFDAGIRAEFVQSPAQQSRPGTRSLEEETTCGYLATAAYRQARGAGGGAGDPDLERWSKAYDLNLLREAILYETIGARRQEVLPLLSDDALHRMVDYVRLFVLPPGPAASAGVTR
jgi:tetratricopeptide (TPR) repeat protein